jgi:hypothetical protein
MPNLKAPTRLPATLTLPPLQIRVNVTNSENRRAHNCHLDAIVEIAWDSRVFSFGAIYTSLSTPKAIGMAIHQVKNDTRQKPLHPLIVVPYLSDERLRELEHQAVSGIDLCGNGIVVIPDNFLVFRTGAPNRFTSSAPIKNIYRGTSSLVARVLLLRPQYSSVTDVHKEIASRGGKIALATVSKALKALDEELIIGRKRGAIRLLQPEKLLDRLALNFERPKIERSALGKVNVDPKRLSTILVDAAKKEGVRLTATGVGSVGRYAVIAKEDIFSLYCTDRDRLLTQVPLTEEKFFPNVELLETEDELAYFDTRYENEYPWASPLQTYLELITGEMRSRNTADQVKKLILQDLAQLPDYEP